jgi:hypothetical protein
MFYVKLQGTVKNEIKELKICQVIINGLVLNIKKL